jgi:transforming growth factor beta receptor III
VLYVLDTPTVVCIAFAAFVIGALLTGALWFIYSNTGSYAPATPLLGPCSLEGPLAHPGGGADPP